MLGRFLFCFLRNHEVTVHSLLWRRVCPIYWWFEKFSRFTMTEQLLVSFLSPPVTTGEGPFLSVIGGYLAVFMLQGATWTQRLTFKPHIGTFFTLSRCPRFMCRHCAGVWRDSGTYRTSNWTDCGLQSQPWMLWGKALFACLKVSSIGDGGFPNMLTHKDPPDCIWAEGVTRSIKGSPQGGFMHFGEDRTHEHNSRDLFLFHSYSIAVFSALSFFSLVFLTALFFLCSASYFTDVSVADSG